MMCRAQLLWVPPSGFEYPFAARVLDWIPCNPDKEVRFFLGAGAMSPWSDVSFQGAVSASYSSSEPMMLSSSEVTAILLRASDFILSSAALFLPIRASASFFFLVSARMVVMESVGRASGFVVGCREVLRALAAFLRRTYSAWWRWEVKSWAVERNSSSTIM